MSNSTILVVNSGSSSVKYQVIELPSEQVIDKGQRDRVGISGGDFANHTEALADIFSTLPEGLTITAVGHRVVHGGSRFREPVLIDDAVVAEIEELSSLAPLHNPPNVEGIRAAISVMPAVAQVAVFDTAFFASLAPAAYDYAIPRELAEKFGIRKYGFHGTSHQFVTHELERLSHDDNVNRRVVSFHLGNGSSVAAVRGGVAIDTSMGFTPLAGLVMGTRSGDLDPAVLIHLQREAGLSVDDVDRVLNRESGLLGLSGHSDMRDLFEHAQSGDTAATEAIDVWAWRARHYLGAYMAQLGGLDAITFTGGIGENQGELREAIVRGCEDLGIVIDHDENLASSREPRLISAGVSKVAAWVIPTNEELQIASLTNQITG